MDDKAAIIRKGRVHDFPEHQVGFPERNDVHNPDAEPAGARPDGALRALPDRDSAKTAQEARTQRVAAQ